MPRARRNHALKAYCPGREEESLFLSPSRGSVQLPPYGGSLQDVTFSSTLHEKLEQGNSCCCTVRAKGLPKKPFFLCVMRSSRWRNVPPGSFKWHYMKQYISIAPACVKVNGCEVVEKHRPSQAFPFTTLLARLVSSVDVLFCGSSRCLLCDAARLD